MKTELYLGTPYIAAHLGETLDVRFPPGNPELADVVEASAELPFDATLVSRIDAEKPLALQRTLEAIEGLFPGKYQTGVSRVSSVSMAQARLALRRAGLLNSVDAVIAAIPDESARADAEISWEYSTTVARDDALVAVLGQSFGLSAEQIDELFTLASTL
jgi:hypothetical protein